VAVPGRAISARARRRHDQRAPGPWDEITDARLATAARRVRTLRTLRIAPALLELARYPLATQPKPNVRVHQSLSNGSRLSYSYSQHTTQCLIACLLYLLASKNSLKHKNTNGIASHTHTQCVCVCVSVVCACVTTYRASYFMSAMSKAHLPQAVARRVVMTQHRTQQHWSPPGRALNHPRDAAKTRQW